MKPAGDGVKSDGERFPKGLAKCWREPPPSKEKERRVGEGAAGVGGGRAGREGERGQVVPWPLLL
eukprot:scaffold250318_cov18-Tisochrysis_lutea.AAC.1